MNLRFVAAALLVAGCLPSSQREQDLSLLPSDSAGVALAARVPVDTLALVWTREPPLPLATGVAWLRPDHPDARLAVVETQQGGVALFTPAGRERGRWPLPAGSFPYLAGTAGDTLVVLARGQTRLLWVADGQTVHRVPVPPGTTAALVSDSLLFARVGGGLDQQPPALVRLGADGRVQSRHAIRGRPWRAVGYLRRWGSTVLALSGYRPVADVWTPGAGAALDTLALRGFDSPLLARSAQFVRGDAEQPPLLAASAAALGDHLFVLNLRDDRIRVDVYRRDGRLAYVLVGPEPPMPRRVVAVDLAVRAAKQGGVDIAVVSAQPGGLGRGAGAQLALYRWQPDR